MFHYLGPAKNVIKNLNSAMAAIHFNFLEWLVLVKHQDSAAGLSLSFMQP